MGMNESTPCYDGEDFSHLCQEDAKFSIFLEHSAELILREKERKGLIKPPLQQTKWIK
jgi:hypothetical protein